MDNVLPVNKNQKSNAECCKDYKQRKKIDANSGEKDIININGYRAKKENQSEAGKITQHEKERLRKQKYRFKKSKIKCQMIITWKQQQSRILQTHTRLHNLYEKPFNVFLKSY